MECVNITTIPRVNGRRRDKPCERCGQMMHNVGSARKYCDDCALLARRDNAERFRRCHRPGKSGPGKDVRTCVREADALGMSYGQYVAAGLDQVADAANHKNITSTCISTRYAAYNEVFYGGE